MTYMQPLNFLLAKLIYCSQAFECAHAIWRFPAFLDLPSFTTDAQLSSLQLGNVDINYWTSFNLLSRQDSQTTAD